MNIPGLSLFPRDDETIEGVARLIRAGDRTCVDVVQACLKRIDEFESEVRAWVLVDREGALAQARERDVELSAGKDRGLLHGIPIGVKDIIDVKGLPFSTSTRPWPDEEVAPFDSVIVENLREAGAIILGKTVSTPYAWIDPPPTRNPWNLDRTPGGSSSGSAAAVACGMCLGAIGTQTGGSIIRPAAFCGVAGMKAGYNTLHTSGIAPLAPSFDTPGAMARCVGDLEILLDRMWSLESAPPYNHRWDDPSFKPAFLQIGGFFQENSEEEMRQAIADVTEDFRPRGAEIFVIHPREEFRTIRLAHRVIMAAEAAHEYRDRRDEHPERFPEKITALIDEGSAISALDYLQAKQDQEKLGRWLINRSRRPGDYFFEALLTPATVGPAPDCSSTGDPIFNSPWSFSGQATISLPIGLSRDGLPLAIQLVGTNYVHQPILLRLTRWCEAVIRQNRS